MCNITFEGGAETAEWWKGSANNALWNPYLVHHKPRATQLISLDLNRSAAGSSENCEAC
jgi:hypothetical protein